MQDESFSSQSLQSDDSSDESNGGVIAKKSKVEVLTSPSCIIQRLISKNKVVRYWIVEDKYNKKPKK